MDNYELKKTLKGHKFYVEKIILSYNRKFLVSESNDKTIKIWNIKS